MPVLIPLQDQDARNSSIPWSAYMTTSSENRDVAEDLFRQSGESLGNEHAGTHASSQIPSVHADQANSATDSNTGEGASRNAAQSSIEDRRSANRTRSKSAQADDNSPKTKPRSEKRKTIREIQQLESNDFDDDGAIGLPKERYKPRPSRSRSTNVILEEPIDFSVRPEKAMKSRSKRNNTTGSIGHLVLSSSEKAERICAMGFSPSNAKQALKACDNKFDQAVEWLLSRPGSSKGQHDAPTAAHPDSSRVITEEVTEGRILNVAHDQSPLKRQVWEMLHVAIPTVKSPHGRKTENCEGGTEHKKGAQDHGDVNDLISAKLPHEAKASESSPMNLKHSVRPEDVTTDERRTKRRKTAVLEETRDTITAGVPLHSAGEKKRGRGRPRRSEKEAETSIALHGEASMSVGESDSTGYVVQVQDECKKREGPPKETENTSNFAIETVLPPNTPPEIATDGTTSTGSAGKIETKLQKPRRGTSGSLSPSGKSKVPLRVGLSKRARIAPLLRVMRK
ncbi:uncharacterized protein BDZ99DRAFT_460680 [Mytilinidion resinicola]|uniref:UBA domain-containing protein n=1 Tax=Mytilinidion resinicola TaxID=574789 RepID=A0A6A6YYD1_9PEZI|nr:uncharacterized protein BDZ99DRAFT_460680 [Mytilinidion resinicola]KAF2813443.1 hypothetical protein BDZ99DRAFT_460680 [Mytilinidion resinicola]